MYIDKDKSGKISIMEISQSEIRDITTMLFEFEHSNSFLSEREKSRLNLFSNNIRFQIIDALKDKIQKDE